MAVASWILSLNNGGFNGKILEKIGENSRGWKKLPP
jgi:hypothetical protein